MREERLQLTDVDARRLRALIDAPRPRDLGDAAGVALLERHVGQAEVLPAGRIDPDIVTIGSEVLVKDLATHEAITFWVVSPGSADAAAGRISVLAPLGMAVLGRRAGDRIEWETPGGLRRLRVVRVLYQPEREGLNAA
jgi:regulator of nucleoside diphosphate kinase